MEHVRILANLLSTTLMCCALATASKIKDSLNTAMEATISLTSPSSPSSTQSDFLLVVLRDMVRVYPSLRVILMSATIDTTLFSSYFGNCPVIEIQGKIHPVQGTHTHTRTIIPRLWQLNCLSSNLLLPHSSPIPSLPPSLPPSRVFS